MAPLSARRRCATMTDAPRTGPPEKRERRPGQEAATLGKAGKVNSTHNATNSVALSPKIDAMALNQWRCENGLKLYPVLLPHGAQSADGSKWCVGTVEIDLKGQTPGRCRDTSTGTRGTGLFDIAEMTGLPWPQTIVRTRKIMAAALAAAAPAKIDAQSPKPNGHDLDHQPNTSPPTRDALTVPQNAAGAPRANGIAAAGHGGDENRPFWKGGAQQPSNTAEPEIIPPALTAAKAAAAALTRDSDSIAIRQVIEKIALARPGALFEEQLLLLAQNQTGTGKKVLNTELRDAKKRQAAARPPQQLQSYNGASDWRENLINNEWGEPKALMTNVCLALGDQVWNGVLGFNEFTAMIAMRRAAPWIVNETAFEERPWTDADTRMATMWVQGVARIHASSLVVFEGIQTVAEQHPYHPVRNYLDALTHDGSPRIDDLLIRYYGAGGDPPDEADGAEAMEKWRRQYAYYQAVGARFLIGAVARIYQPGCKNDCMPNFVGAQGALKSSSLAALFDPWFTDEIADLGSKDAAMQSAGVWCVEISELAAISRVAIA